MPPIKDPITEPTIIPVLLDDDCDREGLDDEGIDDGELDDGRVGDLGVDNEGAGGTKDVTQIYSSLLLISSNNISLSYTCEYPVPIKKYI